MCLQQRAKYALLAGMSKDSEIRTTLQARTNTLFMLQLEEFAMLKGDKGPANVIRMLLEFAVRRPPEELSRILGIPLPKDFKCPPPWVARANNPLGRRMTAELIRELRRQEEIKLKLRGKYPLPTPEAPRRGRIAVRRTNGS
jgi:hypothetical protein